MKNIINYILAGLVLVCLTWIVSKEMNTPVEKEVHIHIDTVGVVHQQQVKPNTNNTSTNKSFSWDIVIAALLGSGGIVYLLIKYFLYDRKNNSESDNKYVLCRHPIFGTIQEILARDIKNIDFDSEGRTEIFRTMVAEQCTAYSNNISKFVNEEKEFSSAGDFRNKMRMMVIRSINDYEKRWADMRVPDIVIEKYKEWHSGRLEVLLNEIDTIALYKHSSSYDQAIHEVLLSISSLLRFGITNDSIRSLGELNGELTGLIFNGKTV